MANFQVNVHRHSKIYRLGHPIARPSRNHQVFRRYAGYAFWTIVALVDTTVLLALFGPVSVQRWLIDAICSVL